MGMTLQFYEVVFVVYFSWYCSNETNKIMDGLGTDITESKFLRRLFYFIMFAVTVGTLYGIYHISPWGTKIIDWVWFKIT